MKRTFPNQTKSVAQCELHTKASMEQLKQTNVDSTKACSSAAMIGLAAISTTMGTSVMIFPGDDDSAVAAELPQVDKLQSYSYQARILELNGAGVNSQKSLLLPQLGYLDTQRNSNYEAGVTQSETVLPLGQKLGASFSPVELKPKKLIPGQINKLPSLGSLGKLQGKKALGNDFKLFEKFKTGINPIQEQKKPPAKILVESKYEEFVSEPVHKPFDLSKKKLLEKNISQKSENLVVPKTSLEIASPKLNNNSDTKQVAENQTDISQESIETEGRKLEAVVIDSEITSTQVSLMYKVRFGDTLSLIANEHNVSVGLLAKFNQIQDPDRIEVAKLLKIPQQLPSQSLTLTSYRGGNSTHLESNSSEKQEFVQPTLETTNNHFDFPEAKTSIIESDAPSYNRLNISEPLASIKDSSHLISSPQATDQDYQIDHKSKEFITSRQSVNTYSPKTPLVNGKVWPTNLTSKVSGSNSSTHLENQIHLSNKQPVQLSLMDRDIQDRELTITDNQENPYTNRLRSEIDRLRQEYNDQKDFEQSQLTNLESINTSVPEALSSENNLSVNDQFPIDQNFNNGSFKPTEKREISNPTTRQWPEEIAANGLERKNTAIVLVGSMEEDEIIESQESSLIPTAPETYIPVGSVVEDEISESQESSRLAAAPETYNPEQILNNPSIGKMVSPDLPPLGKPDSYLPGGSMQFTGYTWPARGILTSGYGWRWGRMHRGIDIGAPTGTPIVAAAPGIVTYADWDGSGYGYLVEIKHPNGSLTLYAHNSEILVREGQKVSQGELIAKMGSTGRSTGPHLHFEIHPQGNGAVDPMAYLPSRIASN